MGRWAYKYRKTVEDSLNLPAKYIKLCIEHPNEKQTITWTWQRSGKKNSIGLTYKPGYEAIELNYTVGEKEYSYYSGIIKQDCNYGGNRYYFECPNTHCQAKVYTLYSPPGSDYFLCRNCHKLLYDEQLNRNKPMDFFKALKYDRLISKEIEKGKPWKWYRVEKLKERRERMLLNNYHKPKPLFMQKYGF